MNILHIIESGAVGGAQNVMESLLIGLRDEGFSVCAALPKEGGMFDRLRAHGIESFHLPIDRLYDTRAGIVAGELVQRRKISVVHVHTPKAGMLTRIPAARAGAKVVMHVHGLGTIAHIESGLLNPYHLVKKKALRALEARSDRRTDRFIFVCGADRERKLYPIEKSSLVYNGIDADEWTMTEPPAGGPIFFPARLSVQKDPSTLLKAVRMLLDRGVHVSVMMPAGGDDAASVTRLAAKLDLERNIEFLAPNADMKAAYARASMTVLSTHWEGQPISILESMAAGRPVIATDVGGVAETLGSAGMLVPRRDQAALASAIEQLLENHSLRISLASKARARVEREFTLARMVAGVADVYRGLVTPKELGVH